MKAKKDGRERLSVSVPPQMAKWLKQEADRHMTSVSGIIQRALLPKMKEDSTHEQR